MDWNKKEHLMGSLAESDEHLTTEAAFNYGLWAFNCGRYAEAYHFFKACGEADAAACFNMALALHLAGLHEDALKQLDKGYSFLSAATVATAHIPLIPKELEQLEAEGNGYLQPMAYGLPCACPGRARQQFLRVKADVLFALGLTEELQKLLPLFAGKNYANVLQIENKINGG